MHARTTTQDVENPRAYGDRTKKWAAEFCSEDWYKDPAVYFGRRLSIFQTWGPRPATGETILQIGCGDGYMARLFLESGYRVVACDYAPELLEKTARRNVEFVTDDSLQLQRLDINKVPFSIDRTYEHTFAVMRSLFLYATDPLATLRELRRITDRRLIFDFNPRQVSPQDVLRAVADAGFSKAQVRACLVPQKRVLPKPVQAMLNSIETFPWLYGPLTRRKFHLWVVAS